VAQTEALAAAILPDATSLLNPLQLISTTDMDTKDEKTEKHLATPEETSREDYIESTQTSVPFEAYLYFAALQRSEERNSASPHGEHFVDNLVHRLSGHKGPNVNIDATAHLESHREIPLSERETASRALRLASTSSVFYLITTDILGPFNAPFAISQVGWVPG
jgi:hypothetical protein